MPYFYPIRLKQHSRNRYQILLPSKLFTGFPLSYNNLSLNILLKQGCIDPFTKQIKDSGRSRYLQTVLPKLCSGMGTRKLWLNPVSKQPILLLKYDLHQLLGELHVTESNLRVTANASRSLFRALLHAQKIHWWIKNCQNNGTCGTVLNGITPSASLTLCKSLLMDFKKSPKKSSVQSSAPSPQECDVPAHSAHSPRQDCARTRRGSVTDTLKTDTERTKPHPRVRFLTRSIKMSGFV